MRVSVYKADDGILSVMVEASPGKGRPPVVMGVITPENVVEKVLPLVTAMRRPRGERAELPT